MSETQTKKEKKKKPMTNEERLALAAKLDQELDDFISGLEKKRYTEGWPEDKWEEEMEKHPFFMTKLPEGGELPPLLEGIQQLKYDENENTPVELATAYKEDGNFNFKHKKYRMAIISYTEGIKKQCGDPEVQSQLYGNRAASHFYLGNYRSALADCREALKLQPNYLKAQLKAAQCCLKLKMFKEATKYCDDILVKRPNEEAALKIRKETTALEKRHERDSRKEKLRERNLHFQLVELKKAIESRKIQLDIDGDILESLEFSLERPILENNELTWPVFLLYPEYSVSDYIEQFNENTKFIDLLVEIFSEPPHWDEDKEYHPDVLNVYYESPNRCKIYSVDLQKTLLQILTSGTYVVKDWKPSFLVFVRGSPIELNFLKGHDLVFLQ